MYYQKKMNKINLKISNIVFDILDMKLNHYSSNCPFNITDLVFLEIEKHYLDEYYGFPKNYINRQIGKLVREHWQLKNLGRHKHPKSALIKSYEIHSN